MEKMKKTAKTLDMIFKIIFWVIIIFCIIFVCTGIGLAIGGDKITGSDSFQMMIFSYSGLTFSGSSIPAASFNKTFIALSVLFLLSAALILYGITVFRKILSPMKEGRPFVTAASQSFRHLGWLFLIFGILNIAITSVAQYITLNLWKSMSETIGTAGVSLTTNHVYDITFIIAAALMFLFSFVFKYGEELQKLSDETI